jgi:hypothetical protein
MRNLLNLSEDQLGGRALIDPLPKRKKQSRMRGPIGQMQVQENLFIGSNRHMEHRK